MGGGGFERVDLAAHDEQFAIFNDYIAISELHLAIAHGLDFPAFQHHAALIPFFKEIVERGFFIFGDAAWGIGFWLGHMD